MKCMEFVGKTIDEAKEHALSELCTQEDKLKIEVIDEGKKGILNFIGRRPAKIKVTVNKDYSEEARKFLKSILDNMKVDAEIDIKESNNKINIELKGSSMGILIGYRGRL
jgi:spoIIIJ-associated protein